MSFTDSIHKARNYYDSWTGKNSAPVNPALRGDIQLNNLFLRSNIASCVAKSYASSVALSYMQAGLQNLDSTPTRVVSYITKNVQGRIIGFGAWTIIDPIVQQTPGPLQGLVRYVLLNEVWNRLYNVVNRAFQACTPLMNTVARGTLGAIVDVIPNALKDSTHSGKAFSVARIAIPILLAYAARARLLYDLSLIYTVVGGILHKQDWFTEIDKNIILSGIPLKHQHSELKKVTHVLTLLEPFEQENGIIEPFDWSESVTRKIIPAPDFVGVKSEWIRDGVDFLKDVKDNNSNAQILVHCKAGRGRSATIVVAERMSNHFKEFAEVKVPSSSTQLPATIEDIAIENKLDSVIVELKEKRAQINLNAGQKATIVEYVKKYVLNYTNRS